MKFLRAWFLVIFAWGAMAEEQPTLLMTYNVMETLGFVLGNQIFIKKKPIFLPFHFDAHIKYNDTPLSFGLIYRYESYHEKGPLRADSGRIRPTAIWTNYHEVFLLAGRRFSFSEHDLAGFYASIRGGLGCAFSPKYFNLSVLAQPEVGYSLNFATPGFSLNFGLGVLLNLPFYENTGFAVPWSKDFVKINGLQVVVHQAIPIINVGMGFNL